MRTTNYLSLDEKKVSHVVVALNQLLADYQVFYANLRGLHWNVKGKGRHGGRWTGGSIGKWYL